ncbi:MAG: hypothetical protein AAF570_08620 [Bacteroidota bacterium]
MQEPQSKPSKRRKWLKFALWNVATVAALLFALEGLIALFLNDPASAPTFLQSALRKYYHEYDQQVIQYLPECAEYDSLLFYRLKPGSCTFSNREFSTTLHINSAGFRDDEASLDRPKMIVLGDSYAMGWGVEQDQTFAQLLEKQLGYPVLNTGVSSYGTVREVLSLDRVNTDSLDYLIVQFCPNDIPENRHFLSQNQTYQASPRHLYEESRDYQSSTKSYFPLKHILNLPGCFSSSSEPSPQPTTSTDTLEKKATSRPPTAEFVQVLKTSSKIPAHTRIIVFALEAERCNGHFVQTLETYLNEYEFASSLHDRMSFVDLTGQIDSTHRFVMDPHLNAAGHAVVAENLLAHLAHLPGKEGRHFWTYPNGDTAIACDYANGLKHGLYRAYWPNGGVSRETYYVSGAQEGPETDYDQNGNVKAERYFRAGKSVAVTRP